MTKMKDWDIRLATALLESLKGVTSKDRAIAIIREWWARPENDAARADPRTVQEAGQGVMSFAASFAGHQSYVIEKAATCAVTWDGLREYARYELAQNRPVNLAIQKRLLVDGRPKSAGRNSGKKPGDYAAEMQRAAIIWALRSETPFKTLTSTGKGQSSAYSLAEEALEQWGVTFEAFRSAYRRHLDIFGS